MSYTKQNFTDGSILTAAHLNHMEEGIAEAEKTGGSVSLSIGTVTTGDTPAAGIRDGKLCLTLPRGEPGPQGDPGEGLSDNAKALLLSLLAGTALDKAAALAALRAEWGLADPDDTTPEAADAADPEA